MFAVFQVQKERVLDNWLPTLAIAGPVAAALIAALVTVYLGKRSASGTPETSEAADLWAAQSAALARAEAQVIRLTERSDFLYAEADRLRAEIVVLVETISKLKTKLSELKRREKRHDQ